MRFLFLLVVCGLLSATNVFAGTTPTHFQTEEPAIHRVFSDQDQNFDRLSTPSASLLSLKTTCLRYFMMLLGLGWLYFHYGQPYQRGEAFFEGVK